MVHVVDNKLGLIYVVVLCRARMLFEWVTLFANR